MKISVKRWKQLAGILKESLGDDIFDQGDMEHGRGDEPLEPSEFEEPEAGSQPLDPATFEETAMLGAQGGPSHEGESALEAALHGDPEDEEADEFASSMDGDPDAMIDVGDEDMYSDLDFSDVGVSDMFEAGSGDDDDHSADWLGGSYVKEDPEEPVDHREQDEYDRTEYHDDGELQFEADDSIASLFEGDVELNEWNFDKKDSDDNPDDSDDDDAERVKAMEDEEDGRAESKGNDPKGS